MGTPPHWLSPFPPPPPPPEEESSVSRSAGVAAVATPSTTTAAATPREAAATEGSISQTPRSFAPSRRMQPQQEQESEALHCSLGRTVAPPTREEGSSATGALTRPLPQPPSQQPLQPLVSVPPIFITSSSSSAASSVQLFGPSTSASTSSSSSISSSSSSSSSAGGPHCGSSSSSSTAGGGCTYTAIRQTGTGGINTGSGGAALHVARPYSTGGGRSYYYRSVVAASGAGATTGPGRNNPSSHDQTRTNTPSFSAPAVGAGATASSAAVSTGESRQHHFTSRGGGGGRRARSPSAPAFAATSTSGASGGPRSSTAASTAAGYPLHYHPSSGQHHQLLGVPTWRRRSSTGSGTTSLLHSATASATSSSSSSVAAVVSGTTSSSSSNTGGSSNNSGNNNSGDRGGGSGGGGSREREAQASGNSSSGAAAAGAVVGSLRGQQSQSQQHPSMDRAFLRVPLECALRSFKVNHKKVNRDIAVILAYVLKGKLSAQVFSESASLEEKIKKIDLVIEKLHKIRDKVQHGSAQSRAFLMRCQKRVRRLAEEPDIQELHTKADFSFAAYGRRVAWVVHEYLCRSGMMATADVLKLKLSIASYTDTEVYEEVLEVLAGFLRQSTAAALEWVNEHRPKLKKLGSPFECELHVQHVVELLKRKDAPAAVAYLKANVGPDDFARCPDMRKVVTLTALLEDPPPQYAALFGAERWHRLSWLFLQTSAQIYEFSLKPALIALLQAGFSALKSAACEGHRSASCPACFPEWKSYVQKMPMPHRVQSYLICPISGELMDDKNPPLASPDGHVYSTKAVHALAAASADGKTVLCPKTQKSYPLERFSRIYVT